MANNSMTRMVWQVSLPIIMVEATETLDHLIDTLFLARVGITELGAIAVVVPCGVDEGIEGSSLGWHQRLRVGRVGVRSQSQTTKKCKPRSRVGIGSRDRPRKTCSD